MFAFTLPESVARDWLEGHANATDLLAAPTGGALFLGYVRSRRELAAALRLIVRHGGPVYWHRSNPLNSREWWITERNGDCCMADRETVARAVESLRLSSR